MDKTTANALAEGLTDAAGFLAGALAGTLLGRWLGFDFLHEPGYGTNVLIGILLVGLGGGSGIRLARAWRARRAGKP